MPKFKDVPTLTTLALKSIGCLVVEMKPIIISRVKMQMDQPKIIKNLQKSIDILNDILVSYVPYHMYEIMAVEVLKAVKTLIDKTKKFYYPHISMSHFLMEMNVAVSLTEVVLNSRLRSIDFSEWPKIMRCVLYKNLEKMTGLENLNLGSCTGGWKNTEFDKNILDGIRNMKNLRHICLCFDCSDLIIQTLSENCPNLQSIDVTSSRSVTDRSIPYLLNCKNLKVLQLHGTSILYPGLVTLISGLPKLQDIGRCDKFGHIVKYIRQNLPYVKSFGLKKIQTRDLCTEHLNIIVAMFPKLEYVSIFHDMQVADLTILVSLDCLRELKLLSFAFYSHYLKQLIEIRGSNLTTLHLEHAEEMDFNALLHIGQYCPHLKNLVLYNCDFTYNMNLPTNNLQSGSYFRQLEHIFWVVDCAINPLDFVLTHAVNIKYVHLGSSTGITHASIVNILRSNPMKYLEELRVLYSSDMSMRTVELLLASCPNLKVLSELESWQGITMEELKVFKNHISNSNFNLDIRPTLSFSS
ncbi:uncharacterized protein LOC115880490 isoform X1 [Sitophilus oryzae]|uniref:Uncharacterized protein LOC115880490 isoform X1 n=1 Tax=Sitophilus oryzae TaxID=7048 RepID=A0A6J2XPX4_SITOR|nr:uncharacterized protein LOC115880490 isoform X1 [Sitophilus oryzae]